MAERRAKVVARRRLSPAQEQRGPSSIHQLKITLERSKPPIWRRVQVSSGINLRKLHDVIQVAMGWSNEHLYCFEQGRVSYGETDNDPFPFPIFGEPMRSAIQTPLRKVAPAVGSKLVYEYDFGDSWRHRIEVEKSLPPEAGVTYPRCLTGRRACPPEDVGGVWGYKYFLEALRDPAHPEHERYAEWGLEDFDAAAFDLDSVNAELGSLGPGVRPGPMDYDFSSMTIIRDGVDPDAAPGPPIVIEWPQLPDHAAADESAAGPDGEAPV